MDLSPPRRTMGIHRHELWRLDKARQRQTIDNRSSGETRQGSVSGQGVADDPGDRVFGLHSKEDRLHHHNAQVPPFPNPVVLRKCGCVAFRNHPTGCGHNPAAPGKMRKHLRQSAFQTFCWVRMSMWVFCHRCSEPRPAAKAIRRASAKLVTCSFSMALAR